ncbi:myo-inositol-1(or 4)-monophosphatase [Hoeflea marina]|uniref:Inositol-1-monophosphatase n=1 Tax=Hoeflea marina TaxID=274592 RepID=A0A317PHJ7_9HYPH|nr:inositol monophosphatase [Hoeflea marina]PWV95376.1 myo-inositol-1(or 4)-monophosphatase [Hoeflea marina]
MARLEERAAFCRGLAVEAGALVMRGFGRARPFDMKGPQDYLTETDGLCEAFIRQRIVAAFPEDGFFGEESGGAASGDVWVVDPIDGTANFARGIPHFCVAIAFVHDGRTELGAICNPAAGDLYFARRGQGATLNGEPIRVSSAVSAQSATVELGWSTRIAKATYLRTLETLIDQGFNVRRAGSGALGLAYVADGRNEAYAESHMNSWDCLIGLLLVEEAGGGVCAFLGDGSLESGGAVLAAAPGLADLVSRATGISLQSAD